MAQYVTPEQLGTKLDDYDRRLRAMETTQRVGLNRLRSVYASAAVDPVTFGGWESGVAGDTWVADDGSTGTGYPQVTVNVNSHVLIFASCRPTGIAAGGAYRSGTVDVGVGVDGGDPPSASLPRTSRTISNSNASPVDHPIMWFVVRTFAQGSHTFKLWAFWHDDFPAAALPRLTDSFLAVLPLD